MNKCILVVAAHADDEALGCGGTIARHVAEGDIVHAVFVADGVTSRIGSGSKELKQRIKASEKARKILGIATTTFMGLPDNRLDSLPLIDIIQPLENIIDRIKPQIIYTHHYGDLNIDHRITHEAVITVSRALPGSSVKEILTFEVVSSTEWRAPSHAPFLPNLFIDISDYLDIKIKSLEAYILEMRDSPHSRSIEHIYQLSKHRGNCVGMGAAEAFMTTRILR